MSQRELMSARGGALSLEAAADGSVAHLRCTGTADLGALTVLEAFLPKLHAELVSAGTSEVTVDFRELEFMNSSCFKTFITWIFLQEGLPPNQGYKLSFVANPRYHWQDRSLHVLSSFAPDRVTIRPDGSSVGPGSPTGAGG